jgi:cathepsin L
MVLRTLAVSAAAVAAEPGPRDYSGYSFQDFQAEFAKGYNGQELDTRERLFQENLAEIQQQNSAFARGESTWWMAVNQFADLSKEEFEAFLGRSRSGRFTGELSSGPFLKSSELPASVDWREKNVLTPVKNQGSCGSCWAFAATATVESAYAIATGSAPPVLGPQAYVSCMKNPDACGGTGGCEGAIAELAFDYTVTNGLPLESQYRYTARDSTCKVFEPAVMVSGYKQLPANDADALASAIANVGPIAVSVAASQWSLYGGGIFTGCTGSTGAEINHAVQAVGYSADYWIIRNSWGTSWGESGFIRLSRSKDSVMATDSAPADGFSCKPYPSSIQVAGECGVLSDSAYPTGASAAASALEV